MSFNLFLEGTIDTIYMTLVSTLCAYIIGLPLGIFLTVTDKGGITPIPWLNKILGFVVNLLRSIPFIILLVMLIPLTRAIVGTSIGTTAMIVPLVIGAAPFIARVVESSLKEVDSGVIEAAQSMGASPLNIIFKVLIPEAKPSLLIGAAISITTILGYTALASTVGGGGLGAIAVTYGNNRFQYDVMYIAAAILVIIVQVLQEVGMRIAHKTDKRVK